MDQNRINFESTIKKVGYGQISRVEYGGEERPYSWGPTDHAWQGWKAAMEFIEPELFAHISAADDFADQIEKLRKALNLISLYPNFVSPGDEESTLRKIAREALES